MPTIDVNGSAVAYDDEGTGTAVVLLHAGIADRRMWAAQVTALAAAGHRAVAPDLPGYGDSALPAAPSAHHDDVVAVLDALRIDRATLVGCSFGGGVALDTALAHPGRVAGLVLFAPALSGHVWSPEFQDLWTRMLGDVDENDLDAMAAAEVRMWVVGPDREPDALDPALLAFAVEMDRRALAAEAALDEIGVRRLDPPAAGRLGEIVAPTVVTVGAADVPEFRRLADLVAAGVPAARRLPDVPDTAHLLPLESPERATDVLLDHLRTRTG